MPAFREVTPIEIPSGRITAITPSPRAAGRFDLVIGGEVVARLGIDEIERLQLRVGLDVDEVLASTIATEAATTRTYDRAIAMLAARGHAAGELRRLLIRKGEAQKSVEAALVRLTAAGFLDDAAFARQFTRSRAVGAGLSRRRIERELTRRGVDRATAVEAIAATFVEEGVDEGTAIEVAAGRKLRTLGRVDLATRRRRLYGFLARRGYDADAIKQVVQRLTKEDGHAA